MMSFHRRTLAVGAVLVPFGLVGAASQTRMPEADPPVATLVTLTEGTNIAASVSPDGATIAFDLLGRIWVMATEGGEATALTDPFGDARQPTWSPDGRRIAFQAYWDGNYHVWSVGVDGQGLRQHTRGPFDHREPDWSPSGAEIAFSSDRGESYDIWSLDLETGDLQQRTAWPGSEYGPAFSPTGERIAYATDAGEGAVRILDDSGDHEAVAVGGQPNGPAWSPTGDALAFNVLVDGISELRVAALGSGEQQTLSDPDEDVFPFRPSWAPDGLIVYTSDGLIHRRSVSSSSRSTVEFRATVEILDGAYERRVAPLDRRGPEPVRGIVSPAVSPDGASVAFSALGDLWILEIGVGSRRITDDPFVETDPTWSPDGSRLAFASDRAGALDVWVLDLASGEMEQVTSGAGATLPSWSREGDRLAYVGSGYRVGVHVVDLETGATEEVRAGLFGSSRPTWSPDGEWLGVSAHVPYSARFREGVNQALLIPVPPRRITAADGGRGRSSSRAGLHGEVAPRAAGMGVYHSHEASFRRQVGERFLDLFPGASVGTRGTDGPAWSPDGEWMAFVANGVLWATPVEPTGDPAGPPRRLTNEIADDPTWTGDSRSIVYMTSDRLRRVSLLDGRIETLDAGLEWEGSSSEPELLVRAGAVFDGVSGTLARDMDIVVREGRIVSVSPTDPARSAARILDRRDAVVMPGLVEMHMHGGLADGEQSGRTWLSYGVTSVRCPACDPYELTEAKEAAVEGRRPSPRWFGTGGSIDGSRIYYGGAPALGATAQVDLELERARALGYDLIKTYVRLSDPVQRRVIEDAHELGIPLSSHELYPAVAYGMDAVEHVRGTSRRGYSTKISELNRSYGDVIALLAESDAWLTPTIGIYGAYGLLMAEDPSLLDDPRVTTFFPWAPQAVDRPADMEVARRMVRDMASMPRHVLEAGGRVVVGTDSPINPAGLSLLAEIEALVRFGDLSLLEVLRATTSSSGEALGYAGELGVVAPGAVADLIVVSRDPTEDIRALREVRDVVARGRVYSSEELLNPER